MPGTGPTPTVRANLPVEPRTPSFPSQLTRRHTPSIPTIDPTVHSLPPTRSPLPQLGTQRPPVPSPTRPPPLTHRQTTSRTAARTPSDPRTELLTTAFPGFPHPTRPGLGVGPGQRAFRSTAGIPPEPRTRAAFIRRPLARSLRLPLSPTLAVAVAPTPAFPRPHPLAQGPIRSDPAPGAPILPVALPFHLARPLPVPIALAIPNGFTAANRRRGVVGVLVRCGTIGLAQGTQSAKGCPQEEGGEFQGRFHDVMSWSRFWIVLAVVRLASLPPVCLLPARGRSRGTGARSLRHQETTSV
jgi:hypothetical protein